MSREKYKSTTAEIGKRRSSKVNLKYISNFDKGITRRRCGKGFTYWSSNNIRIKSKPTINRVKALAIPPAWEEVWICTTSNGHIQAKGRDEAKRTQYIYHQRWSAISNSTKFDRMILMSKVLPKIRRRVRKDLNSKRLSRKRVVAAVVRLLDKAHIRVGNKEYTEEHGSRGATTLAAKHVNLDAFTISLDFPGKSGKRREIEFSDKKTAKVIKKCEELEGQFLFCYKDKSGNYQPVESSDINNYLREVCKETITAKDFRTWWSSVIALAELTKSADEELSGSQIKKHTIKAIEKAANALGNTRAVCKSSYIHPGILSTFESGELRKILRKIPESNIPELTKDEQIFSYLLPHLTS